MTETKPRESGQSEVTGDDRQRFREILEADIDIRIAADGTWYHEGTAFRRKALVKLFSTILTRDEAGEYFLVTPAEKRRITVEDAPFVAIDADILDGEDGRRIRFRTNVDDEVEAGPDHPIRVEIDEESGEPRPYVHVRDRLEALIARAVYYRLVEAGALATRDGREVLEIESRGESFVLGETGA